MPEDNLRSTKTSITPESLIERQRKIVAEHIRQEKDGNWEGVYGTFTSHDDGAWIDAVPFQHRFKGIEGVQNFYETFTASFSIDNIVVHTEVDVPGISVREAQITGKHLGKDYCGVPASGATMTVAMIGVFVFDKATGELKAERLYFDNDTIVAQLRGELGKKAKDPEKRKVFDLGDYED
jgi:hypothetical protein